MTGLSTISTAATPISRSGSTSNVAQHKQPGYAIVNDQPQAHRRHPRRCLAEQIELMADLAERYSFDELRVTHAQNIVLPHVARRICTRCGRRWTRGLGERQPRSGHATSSPAPASIIAASPMRARSRSRRRSRSALPIRTAARLGELKLKISGCINACGHHHAGHIGILGVDRKGTENYQLLLGGSGAEDCSLGKITGPGFDEDGIVDAVEKATDLLFGAAHRGRALPRYLPPRRHG
ncbi:MAG: hypothetical protein LKM31_04130 [Sphingobium sp.]|jgi:sulfite reductase (NADPH) hemoprotein beta-component|nr:hypothetical protein [Sphingobium sp.]